MQTLKIKPIPILSLLTIMAVIVVVYTKNIIPNTVMKTNIMESSVSPAVTKTGWITTTSEKTKESPVLSSAPPALDYFLNSFFWVYEKYQNSTDGTLCTDLQPCTDAIPPELKKSIQTLRDAILERLGESYDENEFSLIFMSKAPSGDDFRKEYPEITLENLSGSVDFIVEKYRKEIASK